MELNKNFAGANLCPSLPRTAQQYPLTPTAPSRPAGGGNVDALGVRRPSTVIARPAIVK